MGMCLIWYRCNKTHGREVQLFCCFSNLTKEEVIQDYEKGPVDQYESLGVNFLSFEEIIDLMVGAVLAYDS